MNHEYYCRGLSMGIRIGIIHQDINKPYSSFEYDKDFIRSGIELSPLRMPLGGVIYEFPSLAGDPFWECHV